LAVDLLRFDETWRKWTLWQKAPNFVIAAFTTAYGDFFLHVGDVLIESVEFCQIL